MKDLKQKIYVEIEFDMDGNILAINSDDSVEEEVIKLLIEYYKEHKHKI